ncbi:unnamed protein product [Anisakis simplex]|uniref:Phospholipid scramblase n=1 Tax=Anisakis simplex TaxID=6269 RepID=A0A0M3JD10_ANISI|nr:unnamed protein product [Anisakis simplex]
MPLTPSAATPFRLVGSGTDSIRRFQRSTEVLNVPQQQSSVIPGDMLAAKIRTYLSVRIPENAYCAVCCFLPRRGGIILKNNGLEKFIAIFYGRCMVKFREL